MLRSGPFGCHAPVERTHKYEAVPDRENNNRIVKFNQVKPHLFLCRATKDRDTDKQRKLHTSRKFTNMQIHKF